MGRRWHLRAALLVPLLGMGAGPAVAGESTVVAVFDIRDGSGRFNPEQLAQLSAFLTTELADGNVFRILPRSQIRTALAEQKRDSFSACYDESCQIEIGRALAAQKSLQTEILAVGSSCAVAAVMFDLRSEASEEAVNRKTTCDQDALVSALEDVAETLKRRTDPEYARAHPPPGAAPSAPLAAVEPTPAKTSAPPAPLAPAVVAEAAPSSGGVNVGGILTAVVAAGGLGTGVAFTVLAQGQAADAEALGVGAQLAVGDAKLSQTVSFIGFGVGGAAALASILLFALAGGPDGPTASAAPSAGTLALTPIGPAGTAGAGASVWF